MENQDKLFELMSKMYGEMQEGFKEVKGEIKGIKGEIGEIKGEIGEIKIRLDKVENVVINMEQDHGKKLSALFDGYEQNSKKLDRIEKEVSRQKEVILRKIR